MLSLRSNSFKKDKTKCKKSYINSATNPDQSYLPETRDIYYPIKQKGASRVMKKMGNKKQLFCIFIYMQGQLINNGNEMEKEEPIN